MREKLLLLLLFAFLFGNYHPAAAAEATCLLLLLLTCHCWQDCFTWRRTQRANESTRSLQTGELAFNQPDARMSLMIFFVFFSILFLPEPPPLSSHSTQRGLLSNLDLLLLTCTLDSRLQS